MTALGHDAAAQQPIPTSAAARRENIGRLVCIAVCLLLCLHAVVSSTYWHKGTHDQTVYWMAGERMRAADAELYAPPRDDSNLVGIYIYPPAFAAIFAPLTLLPRPVGHGLWALCQVGFVLGAVGLLLSLRELRAWNLWAWTALGLLWPVFANVSAGQVNTLVLLLCAAGFVCTVRGRHAAGGLFLALGAHVKILPVALLPILLVQRRFKAVLAMVAFGLLMFALPLAWTVPAKGLESGFSVAIEMNKGFVEQLVTPRLRDQFATNAGGAGEGNLAMSALFDRWLGGEPGSASAKGARWAGFALMIALYGWALWRARNAQGTPQALGYWGLCLAFAMMGNLLAWPAHLVLMTLLLAPALAAGRSRGVKIASAVFIVGFNIPAFLAWQLFLPGAVYDAWVVWQGWGVPSLLVLALCFAAESALRHAPMTEPAFIEPPRTA